MNIPDDLRYTENDEWIRVEGDEARIGITDYAQDQLSDVVYVEVIAEVGDALDQGEAFATVESVKAAADVYMPVSGEILSINEDLPEMPELINSDPYGEAWFAEISLADPAELDSLMDAEAYRQYWEERET